MTRFVGFLIGAGFGLAFVLANSGPPLDPAVALVLRVLAVAALLAVIALVVVLGRGSNPGPGTASAHEGPRMRFGPFYGVVVVLEAVLLFGGIQVLRALDAPMQANVAWIALTVGLHFFPLAWYWRTRSILGAAVYMTVLGAVGLAMAFTGHPDWVPLVSGVVTGIGMLAGILVSLALMNKAVGASADTPTTRSS
ncbi:hypothetical protein A6A08_02970 [Nocardiopsis sp. TSRI0078]|uniref:hypothetical protein n=1 Tax=unclassified Nocardiopsis TaxID=2649073 RepID=UPI00093E202A|nr:hypothetical protein [Nocardiopsis sp. TSRI0078]OKI23741.1 hypothetical protein A6A08_02970 [Nocardiopsis sp. TSRI0078]